MATQESNQKKLAKIRPPRIVMITDVHTGGETEGKELPFVMGVMGDFGGASKVEPKRLKERTFVNIEPDNFNEVMKGVEPRAAYQVPDTLSGGGSFAVDLTFKSIEDFRPEAVVGQIEALRELLETRNKLADLRNKLAGSDKLEDILIDVLHNTENLAELGQVSEKD